MGGRTMNIGIAKAVQSLRPNAEFTLEGNSFQGLSWLDENIPKPTEAEIDAEVIRLQAEYKTQAYARSRKAEYPDWDVQLNKIYDDGIDKWKAEMVDPIKTKYPKIPVVD